MPTTFRPYEPNQTLRLPPDLRDWLPPDYPAYDIADLVAVAPGPNPPSARHPSLHGCGATTLGDRP